MVFKSNSTLLYARHEQLTFAVRAAQPLVTNCFVIEASQLFDIGQNLVDCHSNGVDVLNGAEEQLVREPHCLVISGAVSFRA